jgi:uncharacterized protein (TIGR00297 family)
VNPSIVQLVVAVLLAGIVSALALAFGSLSASGAAAAFFLGAIVYGVGSWQYAIILLAFFTSSSLLSQIINPRAGTAAEKYAKGARRDAGQVLGNGSIAALCVLAKELTTGNAWLAVAFAGSIAAVAADTWATEIGALSMTRPRLITNLKIQVEPGTSGGVSGLGSGAAVLGAAGIAALSALLFAIEPGDAGAAILLGGAVGACLDSVLGATVQAMFECTREGTPTEQHPLHRCGSATVHRRGWRWLNNDWVNACCSLAGAATAAGVFLALQAG